MLTRSQLLLLSTLSYCVHRTHFKRRNLTIGELAQDVIQEIEQGTVPKNPVKTTKREWQQALKLIIDDKKLSKYHVTRLHYHNGLLCFVAKDRMVLPRDVNLVFRGTATLQDWDDNAVCTYVADSPLQLAAYRYLKSLPLRYGNQLTCTGHSKGGNHAAYLAIRSGRVDRAICFDAEGFSPEFLDKYKPQIEQDRYIRPRGIVNVSAAQDIVHALLSQPRKTRQVYIDVPKQPSPLLYHKPTALIDLETGQFHPTIIKDRVPSKIISQFYVKAPEKLTLEQRKKLASAMTDIIKDQFVKAVAKHQANPNKIDEKTTKKTQKTPKIQKNTTKIA